MLGHMLLIVGGIACTDYNVIPCSEAFLLKVLLGETRYLRDCSGILLRKPEYLASKDVHVSYQGRHRNPCVVCFSGSLRRRTRLLISEAFPFSICGMNAYVYTSLNVSAVGYLLYATGYSAILLAEH